MTLLFSKLITTSPRLLATKTARASLNPCKINCRTIPLLTQQRYQQRQRQQQQQQQQQRCSMFTFAGPRNLDDILKLDKLSNKSKTEVSDLWLTYHESKEDVSGLIMNGKDVKEVLSRASKSPFFVQPVFRENGFFMLVSQFISPTHFLFAYLEDYKMDPNRAQPLLTFSLFDDLCDEMDLGLVRCDIVNKGISHFEGLQIVQNTIDCYENQYETVKAFNSEPGMFDVEDYISCQKSKWKIDDTAADGNGGK